MNHSGEEALKALGTCPKIGEVTQAPETPIAFDPRVEQLERLMAMDLSDECDQIPCDIDEEGEEEEL
ncbi:hypothetical protein [Synechococcus sp. MIT S9508]|uniref:hypothetical protein n=1 Tax=Synechococcus sp. MIT S9508 TaxID=1801629 RepID=UPI0007BB040A|nr:hypothetical protein [Synechococcus sp. MIT S9508]KZR89926.1 hypothetical protein MITS9508_01000 [Synechococcus sp. MIT S9508]